MNKRLYLLPVACLLLLLTSSLVVAAPEEVAYYTCDDTPNSAWNSITGSWVGTTTYNADVPTFNASGDGGTKSCDFNGASYITSSNALLQGISGNHSVTMWFKWSGSAEAYPTMLGRGTWAPGSINARFTSSSQTTAEIRGSTTSATAYTNNYYADSAWHHYAYVSNVSSGQLILYIDGVKVDNQSTTTNTPTDSDPIHLGARNADRYYTGLLDEIQLFNSSLTAEQVRNLFNYGNVSGAPVVSSNFAISATHNVTGASLTNFSALVNGSLYSTTNGTIVTNLTNNDTLLDVVLSSNESGGYYNRTYSDFNISVDLSAQLQPYYYLYNVTYGDVVLFNGTNYTRTLGVTALYSCPSFGQGWINPYVNSTYQSVNNLTCDRTINSFTTSYLHGQESLFNYSLYFNASYLPASNNGFYGNSTFQADLNNPNVSLDLSFIEGFSTPDANASIVCTDTVFYNLTYNSTFNGDNLYFGNESNGTNITNATTIVDGTNTLVGVCSDPFNSTTATLTQEVYYALLALIDEQENTAFDVSNITRARVYFDDNSSFYEFNGSSSVNFTSTNLTKLRFELVYPDGGIITRWVDVTLIDTPIRVCANKDGITHYEQLILSASQQPAVLKNVYSNCVVAADYTRFVYQDSYVLKAFTIPALYYIYTFDSDNQQTLLASLDGSISSFYNLDTLSFNSESFNINIQPESVSFSKTANSTIKIYYVDTANDNTALTASITRMDTNTEVFTTSSFTNNSKFTMYYDYTTLSNVTDDTLFLLSLTITDGAGTRTIKRYFNTAGNAGIWTSAFAAAMSFLILVFGLSFTITRSAFSWFGLFIILVAIVIASLGASVWYLALLQVVEAILMLWVGIIMWGQNAPEVA